MSTMDGDFMERDLGDNFDLSIEDLDENLSFQEKEQLQDEIAHAFEDLDMSAGEFECSETYSSDEEVSVLQASIINKDESRDLSANAQSNTQAGVFEDLHRDGVIFEQSTDSRCNMPLPAIEEVVINDESSIKESEEQIQLEERIDFLRNSNEDLNKEIDKLKMLLYKKEDEIFKLDSKVRDLEVKKDSFENKFVEEQIAKNTAIEELEIMEGSMQKFVQDLETKVREKTKEFNLLSGKLKDYERNLLAANNDIDRLNQELRLKDNQIEDLNNQLSISKAIKSEDQVQLEEQINILRNINEDLSKEIDQIKMVLSKKEEHIDKITEENRNLTATAVKKAKLTPEKPKDKGKIERNLYNASHINELENLVKNLEKQIEVHKSSKSALGKKLHSTQAKSKKLEDMLNLMQSTHISNQEHETIVSKTVQTFQDKFISLDNGYSKKMAHFRDAANKVIAAYRSKIEELELELNEKREIEKKCIQAENESNYLSEQKKFLNSMSEFLCSKINNACVAERDYLTDLVKEMNRGNRLQFEEFLQQVSELKSEVNYYKAKYEEVQELSIRRYEKFAEGLSDAVKEISQAMMNTLNKSLTQELEHAKNLMKMTQGMLHDMLALYSPVKTKEESKEQRRNSGSLSGEGTKPTLASAFLQLPKDEMPALVLQNVFKIQVEEADKEVRDWNYLLEKYVPSFHCKKR